PPSCAGTPDGTPSWTSPGQSDGANDLRSSRILLDAPAILQDACKGDGNRPGRLRQRRLDSRPDLGHTALPLPSTGGVRGGPNPASFHSERSPHPMPDVTTAVPNSH